MNFMLWNNVSYINVTTFNQYIIYMYTRTVLTHKQNTYQVLSLYESVLAIILLLLPLNVYGKKLIHNPCYFHNSWHHGWWHLLLFPIQGLEKWMSSYFHWICQSFCRVLGQKLTTKQRINALLLYSSQMLQACKQTVHNWCTVLTVWHLVYFCCSTDSILHVLIITEGYFQNTN